MAQLDPHMITQIIVAVGTLGVCILAIWGDWIRSHITGPKLELELHDPSGDLTTRQDRRRTLYYHVKIVNKRQWAPARRVRILCDWISKRVSDGSFVRQPLIIPVQLTWAFPTFHELLPTISKDDICDLGYLDETGNQFRLSLYIYPNNFQGFVNANEAMQVGLVVRADNFTSRSPFVLEISWDGEWCADPDEMRNHLIIREVQEYAG